MSRTSIILCILLLVIISSALCAKNDPSKHKSGKRPNHKPFHNRPQKLHIKPVQPETTNDKDAKSTESDNKQTPPVQPAPQQLPQQSAEAKVEEPKAPESQSVEAPKSDDVEVKAPKSKKVKEAEAPKPKHRKQREEIPSVDLTLNALSRRNAYKVAKPKTKSYHKEPHKHKEEARFKFCTFVNNECSGKPSCLEILAHDCFLLPNGDSIRLNVETITAYAHYFAGVSNCKGINPPIYLNSTYTCLPNLAISRSYKVLPFKTFDSYYTERHDKRY